jgi:hypothetical protein
VEVNHLYIPIHIVLDDLIVIGIKCTSAKFAILVLLHMKHVVFIRNA